MSDHSNKNELESVNIAKLQLTRAEMSVSSGILGTGQVSEQGSGSGGYFVFGFRNTEFEL